MTQTPALNPDYLIPDEAALRALFPPTHPIATVKCLDHLDKHALAFVARAPFLCIGTQSPLGTADVSPRGDPCGFVKVLDDKTLLIPDRPGNNRLDTLSNIIANPVVGLLFMIPGFDDTLRINGTAQITRDPACLPRLPSMTAPQPLPLSCMSAKYSALRQGLPPVKTLGSRRNPGPHSHAIACHHDPGSDLGRTHRPRGNPQE